MVGILFSKWYEFSQGSKWPALEGQVCVDRLQRGARKCSISGGLSGASEEVVYQSWNCRLFHHKSLHFRDLFSFVAKNAKQVWRAFHFKLVNNKYINFVNVWHLTGFFLLSSCFVSSPTDSNFSKGTWMGVGDLGAVSGKEGRPWGGRVWKRMRNLRRSVQKGRGNLQGKVWIGSRGSDHTETGQAAAESGWPVTVTTRTVQVVQQLLCSPHASYPPPTHSDSQIDSQWEFALWCRELKLLLCDNLEGWDGVGGGTRGRGHVYTCGWFTLMFGRNQYNTEKQLSFI